VTKTAVKTQNPSRAGGSAIYRRTLLAAFPGKLPAIQPDPGATNGRSRLLRHPLRQFAGGSLPGADYQGK